MDITQRRRTLTRLMAIQIFYQFEFHEKSISLEKLMNDLLDDYALFVDDEVKSYRDKVDIELLKNLTNGLNLIVSEIDNDISEFLKNEWTLEKLHGELPQILRFAALELKSAANIPLKVLINEYVDIAAMFFEKSKVTFVNSVVENLAKKYRAQEFETIKKV